MKVLLPSLTGQVFGRWTVLKEISKVLYECRCECGAVKPVYASRLRKGRSTSCGCFRDERWEAVRMDLTGSRYGRLTVIRESDRTSKERRWLCLCDCGNESVVDQPCLRSGNTRSCGCLGDENRALVRRSSLTHGLSKHPLFATWCGMMQRCYNKGCEKYPNYGKRGIRVCDRWHDVRNFVADMGEKPFKGAMLERKNNDGNYEPENCMWASPKQQTRNRSITRTLTYKGETRPMAEWVEITGIGYHALQNRLDSYGWSVEKALSTPVRKLSRKSI